MPGTNARYLYRKPLVSHWFPGNGRRGCELTPSILFLSPRQFSMPPAWRASCVPNGSFSPSPSSAFSPNSSMAWDSAVSRIPWPSNSSSTPCRRSGFTASSSGPVVVRAWASARPNCDDRRAAAQLENRCRGNVIAQGETREPVIAWPAGLPLGYHRLTLTDAAAVTEEVPMIVAPEKAFGGDFDRGWLLAVQLYSVRSERNWGIGDFTDLAGLFEFAKHILAPTASGSIRCMCCSTTTRPIAAPIRRTAGCFSIRSISTSRRSRNFSSTSSPTRPRPPRGSVKAIVCPIQTWRPEMAGACVPPSTASKNRERRAATSSTPSARLARRCCPALPASRCSGIASRRRGGNGRRNGSSRTTPNAPSCATGPTSRGRVRRIRAMDRRQPVACRQELAGQLGMRVGLYLDVAVGVQSNGFDAWNEQGAISRHLAVGAPPDVLNTVGQDWGLAGFNAGGLEAQSFVPFAICSRPRCAIPAPSGSITCWA